MILKQPLRSQPQHGFADEANGAGEAERPAAQEAGTRVC